MTLSDPLIRGLLCALAVWLSGCAQGVAGLASTGSLATHADLATESDELPFQRRARIRLELALAYFRQGQTRVALDEIKQSIAIDPANAEAYNLRGLAYQRLNDLPLASESFQRALIVNPLDPDAAHNYAWLLCHQAQYDASERFFAQAIANPMYAHAAKSWMAQGLCQLRSGETDDAEVSLSRSYELDAGHPVTGYNLAKLLFDRGEFQPAQLYISKLNKGPLANAQTLWLGIRIEQQLQHPNAVAALADQLRGRFAQSGELIAYEREALHD
jgi:type IV pilus assembly protein PilF